MSIVAHREFVLVAEHIWKTFHVRWRAIERQWLSSELTMDELDAAFICIEAERTALRAEIRALAKSEGSGGDYLIPV